MSICAITRNECFIREMGCKIGVQKGGTVITVCIYQPRLKTTTGTVKFSTELACLPTAA